MISARKVFPGIALCLMAAFAGAAPSRAQQASEPVLKKAAASKFQTVPNVPTCATAAVESGNPASGASLLLVHVAPGCTFPWHFHTIVEAVLGVSGVLRLQMKGGQPATLGPSDYAMMPAHHVHMARCASRVPCAFFLHSSGAFDIHYVDAAGRDIPLAEAIAALRPRPARRPAAAGKPATPKP